MNSDQKAHTAKLTAEVAIEAVSADYREARSDALVVEEPLEIVLCFASGGKTQRESLVITMRTPGQDFDLTRGFLLSEGVIRESADITAMSFRGKAALQGRNSNVVQVTLAPHVNVDMARLQRHFYATSSCGVCGKASLEALETAGAEPVAGDSFRISRASITALPSRARAQQGLFDETGGVHAAAAFDQHGAIKALQEDIGRHNAMDKLTGGLSVTGLLPAHSLGVLVSGRASFELLQKAAMAGFPVLAAVGAPSSLAVELAREFNITLVGFVREGRFNIYHRADRIAN